MSFTIYTVVPINPSTYHIGIEHNDLRIHAPLQKLPADLYLRQEPASSGLYKQNVHYNNEKLDIKLCSHVSTVTLDGHGLRLLNK